MSDIRVPAVVLPVYDEAATVGCVIEAVREVFSGPVLVIDDGSDDGTAEVLSTIEHIEVHTHPENLGYGRSLLDGFAWAHARGCDAVLTMDCDGQHEPEHIPEFFKALADCDIVSGSRYLSASEILGQAPPERRDLNRRITEAINRETSLGITDAFCGFKAYRTAVLQRMQLSEPGYGFPLQLWAEAHRLGARVIELPVPRIYFTGDRSFGQDLDVPEVRLGYYLRVWNAATNREG